MRYALFALFENREEEEAALREMEARGFSKEQCRVTAHRDRISEGDLNLAESDAIRGLVFGLVGGFISGAIAGVLSGSFADVFGLGIFAAMVVGAFSCALWGGLTGMLLGAGSVNRRIGRLSRELRRGKVLVTFGPVGMAVRDAIRVICQKHGAHELGVEGGRLMPRSTGAL